MGSAKQNFADTLARHSRCRAKEADSLDAGSNCQDYVKRVLNR